MERLGVRMRVRASSTACRQERRWWFGIFCLTTISALILLHHLLMLLLAAFIVPVSLVQVATARTCCTAVETRVKEPSLRPSRLAATLSVTLRYTA
jgi:hypothetical protein